MYRIVEKKHYLCATMTAVATHKGSKSATISQNHQAVFFGLNAFRTLFNICENNQWTVKK